MCFQELARERQENIRLLKAHQDKDDLIGKLKEEIDLLNRVSPAHITSCSADISSVPFVFCCVGGERRLNTDRSSSLVVNEVCLQFARFYGALCSPFINPLRLAGSGSEPQVYSAGEQQPQSRSVRPYQSSAVREPSAGY